jgi:hypothetical protein
MLTEADRTYAMGVIEEVFRDTEKFLSSRGAFLYTPSEDFDEYGSESEYDEEAGGSGSGSGAHVSDAQAEDEPATLPAYSPTSPAYSPTSPAYSVTQDDAEENEEEADDDAEENEEEADDDAEENEEEADDDAEENEEGVGEYAAGAPPVKRAKVTTFRLAVTPVKGVDCCTMAVNAQLKITDTGKPSSTAAHVLIMKAVRDKSMLVKASEDGIAFVLNAMAAVSTPFAAFYLDLDHTNPRSSFRVFKDSIELSLRTRLSRAVLAESNWHDRSCVPPSPRIRNQLSSELKYGVRFERTAMQQMVQDKCMKVVDKCMEKVVTQLEAVREKWKSRTVKMVKTTLYEVEGGAVPSSGREKGCPKVSVSTMRLPAEILPPAAVHPAETVHYTAYTRQDFTADTIDTIKYELTKFVYSSKAAMQIELTTTDSTDIAVGLVV